MWYTAQHNTRTQKCRRNTYYGILHINVIGLQIVLALAFELRQERYFYGKDTIKSMTSSMTI
jgi:hypothetical protein